MKTPRQKRLAKERRMLLTEKQAKQLLKEQKKMYGPGGHMHCYKVARTYGNLGN